MGETLVKRMSVENCILLRSEYLHVTHTLNIKSKLILAINTYFGYTN